MTKLLILLFCTYALASEHTHIIPVEHYETELQDLGQHVEQHETPVKVIKITKTIAVKIPVPYPVKVIEKVPYPVHVSKPYHVQVPHIVQLPAAKKVEFKTSHSGGHSNTGGHQTHHDTVETQYNSYKVQEGPSHGSSSSGEHSFAPYPEHVHLGGINYGNNQHLESHGNDFSQGSPDNSYNAPVNGHYGYTGDEEQNNYGESKIYDAIKSFL
ncbi:uncharacterized protein [Choristoneura fumiferana]|uniref:uncharacterized protein n=1 Tax=Choristoneura fumiferana TaxID=7141 RepID=UPI003D15D48F